MIGQKCEVGVANKLTPIAVFSSRNLVLWGEPSGLPRVFCVPGEVFHAEEHQVEEPDTRTISPGGPLLVTLAPAYRRREEHPSDLSSAFIMTQRPRHRWHATTTVLIFLLDMNALKL